MKTIPLHSNDRTMENLTKGIPLTERENLIDDLAKKLAEDEEKILYGILLCTLINEGILIEKA